MAIEFDVGTAVLCAKNDAGWYAVQPDGLGADASLPGFELNASFGFAARPVDRDSDGACTTFLFYTGNSDGFAWLGHDARFAAKCPPLTQGSTAQWNSKGAFSLLDAATDTWTLYVPRTNGTRAHTITAGQDSNGSEYIEIRHANGSLFKMNGDSCVLKHTGNAYVEVKGEKVNVNGAVTAPTGLTVGGPAGQGVVNATAFSALMTSVMAALNASPPVTPFEIAFVAAFVAAFNPASFEALCATKSLKAI